MKLIANKTEINLLISKKILSFIGKDKYQIKIDDILIDVDYQQSKEINHEVIDSVEDWIDDWRKGEKTSSGYTGWYKKKPKSMGNKQWCVDKMKKFFQENPQYTKEDVYSARDLYMQKFTDGDYTFLQQADYFIRKEIMSEGRLVIRQELLDYCEELEDGTTQYKSASGTARVTRHL